ncbi:GNAT family protein [Microcella daejeonensis]|uniref:GNAT family N-acetyltransferase n=1 Tax=Microcella daejeonensis TaxID=2994971 RepID=UPI0022707D0E|nr:GNAT family protein [Microcella daejeonensis]WAB83485.1 GNAT family protein [Microcella daejeonensis]
MTIDSSSLIDVPVIDTERLRLEPLGLGHFTGLWASLADEESRRLTGTTESFEESQVTTWLSGLAERDDRADWAIILRETGEFIGEVVLNELDAEAEAMNFRIALAGAAFRGLGFGTEATRAVVDHAFDVIGLHRISLDVFDFNPSARRAYEKAGFVFEGLQRDTQFIDGAWRSSVMMAILADDPRPWRSEPVSADGS